jgi:DNA polymerase III sliding clamp (beta) subunit (PCNA family)
MKLECEIEKIKEGISQVDRITGKNLTLPILNSILFITSNKTLKLRATNLSLGVEVEIPTKVIKEGIVAVPSGSLSGVFSNVFQNENIFFEGEDGNLLIKTISKLFY